jgi:hypothetical protein
MNVKKIKRFLSNPLIDFVAPGTRDFCRGYLCQLGGFPTPELAWTDDGWVELRWERGSRLFVVHVFGDVLTLGLFSKNSDDPAPKRLNRQDPFVQTTRWALEWVTECQPERESPHG